VISRTTSLALIFMGFVIGLSAARSFADDDRIGLKLIWRQQFQPVPPGTNSIFSKPTAIDASFIVRTVVVGSQLLIFDSNGQLTNHVSIGPEGSQTQSPTGLAAAVEAPQFEGVPEEADEIPSIVTGFVSGNQVWQRNSTTGVHTIIADSGASVDLSLYSTTLNFYDSTGHLTGIVLPFGNELPWAFDRPAFGAFSADGSSFALLATASDFQSVSLFVYDPSGELQRNQQISLFKVASGVGISADGTNLLLAGWTVDPVTGVPTVGGILTDPQGNASQQFQVPPIGEQIAVVSDHSNDEFVLDNRNGTIIRIGSNSPPSIFSIGTALVPTAEASAGGITALAALEPKGEHHEDEERDGSQKKRSELVLRLLGRNGTLLFQKTLSEKTFGLDAPGIWLSKDANFVAVRFADEIRYYQIRFRKDENHERDQDHEDD
jgi:hypothetical protein